MRELLFNISGQKLEKNENCNFDDIVMNSNNYLKLLFDFDASWGGSRKAIKLTNGKDKEVNLLIKGNSCLVPNDITNNNYFTLKLYGKNNISEFETNELIINQI
jgi:hypothetical protein